MWDRIDAALAHYARATSVMDREAARQRLDRLRWDMDTIAARVDTGRPPIRIEQRAKTATVE